MSIKGTMWSMMAMASMFGGGMPQHLNSAYIPPSTPIPFSFKRFKRRPEDELPKGCKCDRTKLVFIKPSSPIKYKVTVEVDIVYGTLKAGKKKLVQYQNEIGYFIYHTPIRLLERHKEDILIEEVIEETKGLDEVKTAYRQLSLLHHPDKGGNKEKFIEVTEAKNKCLSYLSNKQN